MNHFFDFFVAKNLIFFLHRLLIARQYWPASCEGGVKFRPSEEHPKIIVRHLPP
jgi:hypothetical protein